MGYEHRASAIAIREANGGDIEDEGGIREWDDGEGGFDDGTYDLALNNFFKSIIFCPHSNESCPLSHPSPFDKETDNSIGDLERKTELLRAEGGPEDLLREREDLVRGLKRKQEIAQEVLKKAQDNLMRTLDRKTLKFDGGEGGD